MPIGPNILRLSDMLYWLVSATAFVLPALVLAALLRDVLDPGGLVGRVPGLGHAPGAGEALAAGFAGLLPLAALVYTLWQMRALFGRYRTGEILSRSCAHLMLRIGRGLFALAGLGILAQMLQLLALSWGAPSGQRVLAFGLDSADLGFLLSGAFVLVVGRVMAEAARVAEENEAFV